jgi:hypothetical protein
MPIVKLNQLAPYQLCGVLLLPDENNVSDADYSVLNSQAGFLNDVKNGLIEVKEAPKAPATPKGK